MNKIIRAVAIDANVPVSAPSPIAKKEKRGTKHKLILPNNNKSIEQEPPERPPVNKGNLTDYFINKLNAVQNGGIDDKNVDNDEVPVPVDKQINHQERFRTFSLDFNQSDPIVGAEIKIQSKPEETGVEKGVEVKQEIEVKKVTAVTKKTNSINRH